MVTSILRCRRARWQLDGPHGLASIAMRALCTHWPMPLANAALHSIAQAWCTTARFHNLVQSSYFCEPRAGEKVTQHLMCPTVVVWTNVEFPGRMFRSTEGDSVANLLRPLDGPHELQAAFASEVVYFGFHACRHHASALSSSPCPLFSSRLILRELRRRYAFLAHGNVRTLTRARPLPPEGAGTV